MFDAIGLLRSGKRAEAPGLLARRHLSASQEDITKALRDADSAYRSACQFAEGCYDGNVPMEVAVSKLRGAYPSLNVEQAQRVMSNALMDMR